jgi:uncharacterized protein (DUF4213/DUF364 family)
MNVGKLEKLMPDVIEKLEKLKHVDLAAELSWCWVSFQNDQNPEGVIEKTSESLSAFQEAREKNTKSVAKKLVEDLEKALG